MKRTLTAVTLLCAVILMSTSCKKSNDAPSTPVYTVPALYSSFTNIDSVPAKTILSMFGEMENTIALANTPGKVVADATLRGMLTNTGNYFIDTPYAAFTLRLNTSGMQLSNLISSDAQLTVTNILDSVAAASQTGTVAASGTAGVSDRNTLLSANGVFWRQYFTKTLMGVLVAHQIADVYLGDSLNSNISNAAKMHAWDQAFLMWCVPVDFPANRAKVKYWGSYTSQIDSGIAKPVVNLTGINANTTLLNAFLKGRAALQNNDNTTALAQATIIINFFETMEAAAAAHEINEAKGNLANGASAVCGNLSESMGFWNTLKFNKHKKISDADYQAVLTLYGTNFYNLTPANIQAIQDKISSIYGWDSIKSNM